MKLELIGTDARQRKIAIDQLPVIVGLDPCADICLDDSSIGHYQCMIDQSDGALMVWDLGTKLGTWVNGVRVSRKSALAPGDLLTVGKSTFAVHYESTHGRAPRHSASAAKKARPAKPKGDLVAAD